MVKQKKQIVTLIIIVIMSMTILPSICFGDILDWIFGKDPIEEAVDAIEEAIEVLGNESANWRDVLQEMEKHLVKEAQSTVRNEISNLLSRTIAASGAEVRCIVDFSFEGRVVQELVRMKAKLLGESIPAKEPAFCTIVPLGIDMTLIPDRLPWLEFYGYNFDTTPIQVLLQEGYQYVDVSQYLQKPTHYHMTLNLGRNGVPLSSKSQQLILKWNNKTISEISIAQPSTSTFDWPPVWDEPCSWERVGYQKSHHPDKGNWCPEGSFITQMDLDNAGDDDASPIIGSVRCCKLSGQMNDQWGRCVWNEVGYNLSHRPQGPFCPDGTFITQLDLDSKGDDENSPIIGRAKCCQLPGGQITQWGSYHWHEVGKTKSHHHDRSEVWCGNGFFLTGLDIDGCDDDDDCPIVGRSICHQPMYLP